MQLIWNRGPWAQLVIFFEWLFLAKVRAIVGLAVTDEIRLASIQKERQLFSIIDTIETLDTSHVRQWRRPGGYWEFGRRRAAIIRFLTFVDPVHRGVMKMLRSFQPIGGVNEMSVHIYRWVPFECWRLMYYVLLCTFFALLFMFYVDVLCMALRLLCFFYSLKEIFYYFSWQERNKIFICI